jgi:hypothetical protein
VGGRTSGSATTDSTKNFHRNLEKTSQYAKGTPKIRSNKVVTLESFRLRRSGAAKFMTCFLRYRE